MYRGGCAVVPGGKVRTLFPAAALVALAALCAVSFMGARRTFRGVPLGTVLEVDARSGAVSVDLGEKDGVLKGIRFSVADGKGRQVAVVTPADVYDDFFWSSPIPAKEAAAVRPGMQVRWIFTPELSLLLQTRKKNDAEAYRNFAAAYPDSIFLPQLVRRLPEPVLKEVDPGFYEAWKLYTAQGFEDYLKKNPEGGFASAARAELKSLKEYEAERERERLEREKRAAAYQEEMRRQEEIRERALALQRLREKEELHGKLVNNSSAPVRFVFEPPSIMPQTVVKPGEEFEVNHPEGTYKYKVYAVQEDAQASPFGGEDGEPQPLAEGTVEIVFDFWSLEYP